MLNSRKSKAEEKDQQDNRRYIAMIISNNGKTQLYRFSRKPNREVRQLTLRADRTRTA